jgi:hypothetical protein
VTDGPTVVGAHDGYTYSIFEASPPPLGELMTLAHAAWAADYGAANRGIFKLDEAHLRWMLPEGQSFCTWAAAPDGTPAGCVLHIERDFFCRGRWFKAYYGTLLSVPPQHRGRRIGERLMHYAFDWMFDVRRAEVEIGIFDLGQAGQPVITRSIRTYPAGHDIIETTPLTMWATTASVARAIRYEPPEGLVRIAALPGIRRLFEFRASRRDLDVAGVPPSLPENARLATAYAMGFGWTRSVPAMYAGEAPSGGVVGFTFGDGERCAIAYHVMTMMRTGEPDARVGVIQFIDRDTASTANVVRALRHVTARLLADSCISVALLDTGVIPQSALFGARYFPTPRKLTPYVTARRELVDSIGTLSGPYFIDLY